MRAGWPTDLCLTSGIFSQIKFGTIIALSRDRQGNCMPAICPRGTAGAAPSPNPRGPSRTTFPAARESAIGSRRGIHVASGKRSQVNSGSRSSCISRLSQVHNFPIETRVAVPFGRLSATRKVGLSLPQMCERNSVVRHRPSSRLWI